MKFLTEMKILSGNFTTIIDNYLNLKKHVDIQPAVIGDFERAFNLLYRNVGDMSMLAERCGLYVEDDTILTTFKFIVDFYRNPQVDFRCKNLVVLDTWNYLLADHFGILEKCYDVMDKRSERVVLLGNPALFPFFKRYKHIYGNGYWIEYHEYYEKLSKERLEFIRPKVDNGKWLVRGDEIPARGMRIKPNDYFKATNKEIFECRGYQYHRYNHLWHSPHEIYFENIGKLLFEFRYFGKPVKYYNINHMEDGLTHYLRLFGVDDTVTQDLKFTREDVEDKLFMKEDDLLIQILRSL